MDPSPAPSAGPRHLDPRAVLLWRLQRLLNIALFGLPLATAMAVGLAQVLPRAAAILLAGGFLLVRFALAIAWPALSWRSWRYELREHDLLVQSGVLFRRWSSVPHRRIQHVDTRQGPLERWLGLSRLLVYTAAGMSADGVIPGLSEAEAERLRDELSRRGGDDGV